MGNPQKQQKNTTQNVTTREEFKPSSDTHKIHGKMRENEGFDLSLLFRRSKTEQKKEYTNATPQTAKAL